MTRTHSTTPDINGSNPATHFGKQVHKERVARGWTIRDLSRESGLDPGHLSRIERGLSTPTEYAAAKLDKTFTHRKGWFSEYQRDSQAWTPPGYRHWTDYENAATRLHVWSPGVLDGLLQTEDYAQALLATFPNVPEDVIAARLRGRMERQRRIVHRENPPTIVFLIDELSLYRFAGSAEIMAAQMDHLLAVANLPYVTIQAVPASLHPAVGSELIVADNSAYVEHLVGGYVYTEPETVTSLDRMLTTLQAESYRASETIQIIERLRTSWANGVNPLTAAPTAEPASK